MTLLVLVIVNTCYSGNVRVVLVSLHYLFVFLVEIFFELVSLFLLFLSSVYRQIGHSFFVLALYFFELLILLVQRVVLKAMLQLLLNLVLLLHGRLDRLVELFKLSPLPEFGVQEGGVLEVVVALPVNATCFPFVLNL